VLSFAVMAVGILGINAMAKTVNPAAAAGASLPVLDTGRLDADGASRDFVRPTPAPSDLVGIPFAAQAAPAGVPAGVPVGPVTAPVKLRPVADLTQAMMDHAVSIVQVSKELKLPRRAAVVAITTALQETHLRNFANSTVPASLKLPHDGAEHNFDSVGLFQQRPSQGWGSVNQLMDPRTAARLFYNRLVKVPNWQGLSVGSAAQAVQRSAFPAAYDKQQSKAETIVDAIL
jgi:hypothetical protein